MGKTNHPLTVMVPEAWMQHEKVVALATKGHRIISLEAYSWEEEGDPDLILHPKAWKWSDEMWSYLEAALKAARAAKPKKGKA